ncbi:MAG: hypothetical protein QM784_20965 [Polyangiaceae bacterium]
MTRPSSLRLQGHDDPCNDFSDESAIVSRAERTSGVLPVVRRPGSERIFEPEVIRSVLASLCTERATGCVRAWEGTADRSSRLAPRERVAHFVQLVMGPRLLVSAACPLPWVVELQGAYSLVRFVLRSKDVLGDGTFALPTELERIYRRADRRVGAPPSARIRLMRARGEGKWLERPLRDVGFGGLRFDATESDDFFPGETSLRAEVTWKHGSSIPVEVTVRHVSMAPAAAGTVCGVLVEPATEDSRRRWLEEVSGLLHPRTELATADALESLWELYEASGYFGLDGRNASDFIRVKPDFLRAFERFSRAPSLGSCVIQGARGKLEASMSLLRVWSGGWLAYQGARRQGDCPLSLAGNGVLKDMFFHAHELAQQDPCLHWNVSFVRTDARFTHLSNFEFVKNRQTGNRAAIVPFQAIEVACVKRRTVRGGRNVVVSPATPRECRWIATTLALGFPRPYLEAYDFVADRIELKDIKPLWSAAGLERDRAILVVRQNGQPMAAALLDRVEPGIHLVGLLDSAHLVSLHTDGHRYFAHLVEAAIAYYADHGWRKFILYEESGDGSYLSGFDVRDLGAANQLFMEASLTPEYLEHISAITAPREVIDGGVREAI